MKKRLLFAFTLIIMLIVQLGGCASSDNVEAFESDDNSDGFSSENDFSNEETFENIEALESDDNNNEFISRNDFSLDTAQRISNPYNDFSILLPVKWVACGYGDQITVWYMEDYEDDAWDFLYSDRRFTTELHFAYTPANTDHSNSEEQSVREEDLQEYYDIGEEVNIGELTLSVIKSFDENGLECWDMYGRLEGAAIYIQMRSPEANKLEDSDIQNIIKSIEVGALGEQGTSINTELLYRNIEGLGLEAIVEPEEVEEVEEVEITEEPEPIYEEEVEYNFTNVRNLKIEGKWQSVGETGFGQAQPGAIIIFDGNYCNFYSPRDAYALLKEDGTYSLSVTSLMGESRSYTVNTIDKNNIVIAGATLTRVE